MQRCRGGPGAEGRWYEEPWRPWSNCEAPSRVKVTAVSSTLELLGLGEFVFIHGLLLSFTWGAEVYESTGNFPLVFSAKPRTGTGAAVWERRVP